MPTRTASVWSATSRYSWHMTAPTCGPTRTSSSWTLPAGRPWWPACRPTSSARRASAGATRSTAGPAWWIERFRHTFQLVDIARLDHFRGFQAYWEVPAAHATAETGRWVAGPG